eukprot:TRINITY_DN6146_c0_g1_i2.p1 TRINITY_DN6146_c0_g1~~TRINITY_DN6146_c0_g1_i2.p1  ORF type:complete len:295 (-),score=42.34 TRINITY_DN6146_c0_g1_i2:22-906(-)
MAKKRKQPEVVDSDEDIEEELEDDDEEEQKTTSKVKNHQRTLIFATRGITFRDRHLMGDLRDLMPHSKRDAKFDSKEKLEVINEIAELKNCNNCIFFEARKHKDLYLWVSRCPSGPSVKFLVQNIHTMDELKLTGNCLKGSRPIMSFDKNFDSTPHWKLLKELLLQVFGSPKGHSKTKPFVDHVFSWFIVDDRIWFRNYQIVYDEATKARNEGDPVLVEVGPRFVLNPIRIFSGSFQGATLFENNRFVSPNVTRAAIRAKHATKYVHNKENRENQKKKLRENVIPAEPIDKVFQ